MKCSGEQLFTPVYLKLREADPWPTEEKAFHMLSRDGLFLCRNTQMFRSCVPARSFPGELAGQQPFLQLKCPPIPVRLVETVVGFFSIVAGRQGAEAIVLLAWDEAAQAYEAVVPDQVARVVKTHDGCGFPVDLEYEAPVLPPHLVVVGDIHSHVNAEAFTSATDAADETHRPGLHLVVGRIHDEPPQFHCEAVSDGCRFLVRDLKLVLQGYRRRRLDEVPPEWLRKVTVQVCAGACVVTSATDRDENESTCRSHHHDGTVRGDKTEFLPVAGKRPHLTL